MEAKTTPTHDGALAEPQLPAAYQAADEASMNGQRLSMRLRAAQLLLLVLAALVAALPWTVPGAGVAGKALHWGALMAGIAFAAAGLIEATILTIQPEKAWYQGRAVAESVKSLAWRYAVGGRPFGHSDATGGAAAVLLTERIRQVLADFDSVRIIPLANARDEITDWMHTMRSSSLAARRSAYRLSRIENQCNWYSNKARWNHGRSVSWSFALLAVQTLGVVGAIVRGTGLWDFDLLGVMAAIATAAVAWLQIKQHANLAQSYSHAAHELATIHSLVPTIHAEAEWAVFVDNAESAISREHTGWRAKRE